MPLVRATANWFIAIYLVLVSLLGVAATAGLLVQREQSSEFTRCTAQWQADFLSAYKARFEAARAVSKSMDHAMQSIKDQDPEAFNASVDHYLATREQQSQEWAKNPLPPLPVVRCGR